MAIGRIALIILILNTCLLQFSNATVSVRAMSGNPVSVCTPHDNNSNCLTLSAGPTVLTANVGVGSTNPGQALDVQGTVRAISFIGNGSQLSGINQYWVPGVGNVGVTTTSPIGIGTTSPQGALQVNGNVGVGAISSVNDTFVVNALTGGATINGAVSGIGGIDVNTAFYGSLNNTLNDSSINAAVGTNNGSFSFSNSGPPFVGTQYAALNGSSQYVTWPSSTVINNAISGSSWTFDGWVNFSSLPPSSGAVIMTYLSKMDAGTNNGFFFGLRNLSGSYDWTFGYENSGSGTQPNWPLGSTPSLNTWYFWQLIKNGTNLNFCWNGSSIKTSTVSSGAIIAGNTTSLTAGANNTGGTLNFYQNGGLFGLRIEAVAENSGNCQAVPTGIFTPSYTSAPLTFANSGAQLDQITPSSITQDLRFIVNGNTAQTISSTGNVGIGSTNPQASIDLGTTGTIRSNNTSGIGWTVKTGANTACNTTCGSSACVLGFDTGLAGSDVVNCASALADTCVCAGP